MRVSEIHVKQVRVNQGLGVVPEFYFFSLFSDTKLKYEDANGNINVFNSVDEISTKFIPFQTLNGYKKIELTGKFELLTQHSFTKNESGIF